MAAQAPGKLSIRTENKYNIPDLSSDTPPAHVGQKWAEMVDSRFGGLISRQGIPSDAVGLRCDQPLLPELDEHDHHYHRRVEHNIKIADSNEKNFKILRVRQLETLTDMFNSLKSSCEVHAPLTAKIIQEACIMTDEGGLPLDDGCWKDGLLAREIIFMQIKKGSADDEHEFDAYYERLDRRQIDNRLPASCTAEQFARKINFYLIGINMYLSRPREGKLLSEHFCSMVPACYDVLMYSLKDRLKRDKLWEQPLEVGSACRRLIAQQKSHGDGKGSLPEAASMAYNSCSWNSGAIKP